MKKILIVEDNENNLYLIKFMLERNNYSTIIAKTGEEGIKKAIEENPDLILMDVQLPDINGIEATKRIRSFGKVTSKIVAVTSYAMTGDKEKVLKAGCDGYIEKPINPETFINELKHYLS